MKGACRLGQSLAWLHNWDFREHPAMCFWHSGLRDGQHVLGVGSPPVPQHRPLFMAGQRLGTWIAGISRRFKKSSSICEEQSHTAHCWSGLLLLSIAFNSFTRLLFTSRFCLYRHGAARFTVEEFPPLDGRFSLLRRKDFPSYRGKISPSIVEGILASWKDLPG